MAKRLTNEEERSPPQRRRGREQPHLDPPLTNGADRHAAGLAQPVQYNDVTAALSKPKKKSKKKKKAEAALQGLQESPVRYDPGPAPAAQEGRDHRRRYQHPRR